MGRRKQVVPKKTDEGQGTPATQDEGEAYFHWFTCVPPKPQELEDIVKLFFFSFHVWKCREIFGPAVCETDLTFKRRSQLS